jgi:NRPS condensation-like uncharacterized protein
LDTPYVASASPGGRFTAADEVGCHFDTPDGPNNVHFEVRTAGPLDPARLREAVRRVAASHVRYQMRRRRGGRAALRFHWEVPERAQQSDLYSFSDVASGAAQGAIRRAWLNECPRIDTAPPLRVLHLRSSSGDSVLFNVHHSLLDGYSLLHFAQRVATCYASLLDRDILTAEEPPPVADAVSMPSPAPYGFEYFQLPRDVIRPAALKDLGTINDFMVAGLAATIREFGADSGSAAAAPVLIVVPVGEASVAASRPGNFSSTLTEARVSGDSSLTQVLTSINSQISRDRREFGDTGVTGSILAPRWLPVMVKARAARLLSRFGRIRPSHAVLTNLGWVSAFTFGDTPGSTVTGLYFSAPARMPRGLCVGAIGLGDTVYVCVRYHVDRLSPALAASFADRYARIMRNQARSASLTRHEAEPAG